jgi:phospholipid/cholesterol/gamma-HCH transport system permease protein
MSDSAPETRAGRLEAGIIAVGHATQSACRGLIDRVRYLGGIGLLLGDTLRWIGRATHNRRARVSPSVLAAQMVRVGVRSIPIVVLVQTFIGIILALQLAPTMQDYGSIEKIAVIIGIAMFRELGPLLSAVVLSGFAGASIAAELGAMVEAEEIKALRAHALNPVRFLVVPRCVATVVMMVGLTLVADVVGVLGGLFTAWFVLDVPPPIYLDQTYLSVVYRDMFSGLIKAGVFGLEISMIGCYEGLSVSGGAEGVGRATTNTVVKSIVALIATDCVFTSVFYLYKL